MQYTKYTIAELAKVLDVEHRGVRPLIDKRVLEATEVPRTGRNLYFEVADAAIERALQRLRRRRAEGPWTIAELAFDLRIDQDTVIHLIRDPEFSVTLVDTPPEAVATGGRGARPYYAVPRQEMAKIKALFGR